MATPEGSDYVKKATVLSVIWFFYPVVFIIGQEGLRLWSPLVDAVLFTSLDLIAKVAYGLWAVSLAGKRDPAQQTISVGGSTRLATGH
jgi:bacteriorhodopsin